MITPYSKFGDTQPSSCTSIEKRHPSSPWPIRYDYTKSRSQQVASNGRILSRPVNCPDGSSDESCCGLSGTEDSCMLKAIHAWHYARLDKTVIQGAELSELRYATFSLAAAIS